MERKHNIAWHATTYSPIDAWPRKVEWVLVVAAQVPRSSVEASFAPFLTCYSSSNNAANSFLSVLQDTASRGWERSLRLAVPEFLKVGNGALAREGVNREITYLRQV